MQRLLVGVDLAQIFQLAARQGEQRVLDLDRHAAHDEQVVAQHQVVVVGDRTGQRVLDGDDAVEALPAADRLEYLLEGGIKPDVRLLKRL